MIVTIKNTSVSDIKEWGGQVYDPLFIYTMQEADRVRLLGDLTFISDLTAGIAEVKSNGTTLDKDTAIAIIRALPVSQGEGENVLVASDTYNFTGNVTVSSSAGGKVDVHVDHPNIVGAVLMYAFTNTGNSVAKWLGAFDKDLFGNQTHCICPFAMELVAMTYCSRTITSNIDVEVHKATSGNAGNDSNVLAVPVVSKRVYRKSDFAPMSFNAGDKFAIFIKGNGPSNDAQDPLVTLIFKITAAIAGVGGESYSDNF